MIIAAALALTISAPAPKLEAYIYQKCKIEFTEAKAREKARYYAPLIKKISKQHKLSPMLVASVIWHESNFNPREISSAGALGLMQVMPFHFKSHGYKLSQWKDPHINLTLGAKLLAGYRTRMRLKYPGISPTQLDHRTLVAYNMGPLAVSRGITRSRYSRKVLQDLR